MAKTTPSSDTDRARASKRTKTGNDVDEATENISYVEFYSGIGGWTMAIEEALKRLAPTQKPSLERIAALDHSDLCTLVFQHNFGTDKKSFRIEKLTIQQVHDWNATIWAMSPPCQPHTRQHGNQKQDLTDPRSASFLHLCDLIASMDSPPPLILLENVIGFEASESFRKWQDVLQLRGYHISHFHLTPTQVGLPNDRPRYFGVAVRQTVEVEQEATTTGSSNAQERTNPLQSYLQQPQPQNSPTIITAIPELDVVQDDEASLSSSLPPIASFLDKEDESDKLSLLRVPEKVLQSSAAWCFDIVTPKDQRSSCFTSSYGKYNRGTGSILYNVTTDEYKLMPPEEREFQEDWAKNLDVSKVRYFSGMELARLFGFSNHFSFPPTCTVKQRWKLLGNSLNVRLAARIVEFGLRLMSSTNKQRQMDE